MKEYDTETDYYWKIDPDRDCVVADLMTAIAESEVCSAGNIQRIF